MKQGIKHFLLGFFSAILFFGVCLTTVVVVRAEYVKDIEQKFLVFKDLNVFANVLAMVSKLYVEEVDSQSLVRGAIEGMLLRLDPHTIYLDPEEYKQFQGDVSGKFGGLGISIEIKNGFLTIVSVFEGTPAEQAGLSAGDRILKIDDTYTDNITLFKAVNLLRGDPGTKVTLSIMRPPFWDVNEVEVTRAMIKVDAIKRAELVDKEFGIGLIAIQEFTDGIYDDFIKKFESLKKEGMKALILDLRNNHGGELVASVDIAGKFLEKGTLVVYTKGRNEKDKKEFLTKEEKPDVNIPLVILINGNSASAAEIVAGALSEYGRAVLVGEKTFGKGTVQQVFEMPDGSAIKMTTEKYYLPKGDCIDKAGIEPDIVSAGDQFILTSKDLYNLLEADINRPEYVFNLIKGQGLPDDAEAQDPNKDKLGSARRKFDMQLKDAINIAKALALKPEK